MKLLNERNFFLTLRIQSNSTPGIEPSQDFIESFPFRNKLHIIFPFPEVRSFPKRFCLAQYKHFNGILKKHM